MGESCQVPDRMLTATYSCFPLPLAPPRYPFLYEASSSHHHLLTEIPTLRPRALIKPRRFRRQATPPRIQNGTLGVSLYQADSANAKPETFNSIQVSVIMLLLLCLVPILAGIVQYLSPFSGWGQGAVSNITNSSIPVQQNAGDASRHRILTAMHGYSRYREKNLENTNRWRDFYKRIPKRQRSVRHLTPCLPFRADRQTDHRRRGAIHPQTQHCRASLRHQ